MANRGSKGVRGSVTATTRRQTEPQISDEEEQILRQATIHLIHKHGGLFVATRIREESSSPRTWVISVTLRYPTGHEGYVGDLLYDGKEFTFLTPPEVRTERVRKIAEDPERERRWNEYRASTLQPGKEIPVRSSKLH
jgi:hypothetical protein